MTENPAASDWMTSRGAKWRAQLVEMEAMLRPVDAPLIGALDLAGPCRVADIGCGGGGTSLEIARRAPAGSVVHGFDISPDLIEVARSRIPPGQNGIAFDLADMATSPPVEPYDRLVSRFGVMFFDRPLAAFANVARWLAPGGRFAFAVWGSPADNPWTSTVRSVVADVVDLPTPDPDAPGPFRYSEEAVLLALLDRAGFREVDVGDWHGVLPVGGGLPAADAATFALAAFSSFGEALTKAGEAAYDEARRSLTRRFSEHLHDGVVRMDARVHIVTGTR